MTKAIPDQPELNSVFAERGLTDSPDSKKIPEKIPDELKQILNNLCSTRTEIQVRFFTGGFAAYQVEMNAGETE